MPIELICTIAGTVVVIGGILIKYGADQQARASKDELQDMALAEAKKDCLTQWQSLQQRVDGIEKRQDVEEARNTKQHEDFYKTRDDMTSVKADMAHILKGIDEIKERLSK